MLRLVNGRLLAVLASVLVAGNAWALVPKSKWMPQVPQEDRGINPALQDGEPLLTRRLTPAQHRAWAMTAPFMKTDEASRLAGPLPLGRTGHAQFATGPVGDIFVFEGTNQIVLSVDQNGNPCTGGGCYKILNQQGGAMQTIATRVLQEMGDVYDSIVVWTTFEDYSVAAYYQPLRNDTRGLGVCDPNATTQDALFGCQFDRTNGARLQGVIYMNSVGLWRSIDQQWGLTFGLDDFQSQTYAVLGQESAHRWLVGFHFRDGRTGRGSTELLGRDFSHWNIKADTAASVMDGLDWVDNNDGTFTAVGDNDGYSQLDLYGMGLLAKEEVEPLFIVEGAHSERLKAVYRQFQQNITGDLPDGTDGLPAGVPPIEYMGPMPATGTRVDVDIDMVVAMSGERVPSYADSQKAFNQAFVLVTLPGQTAGAAANDVDELEVVRRTWEMFFAQKTLGRGTMCTALSGTCAPSVAEIVDIRWSDAANNPSDGEWGRGEETDVYLTLKNGGGAPIESVGATLSTSSPDVTITNGNVVFGTLSGGSRVESPTAFRVKLGSRVSCDTHSVPVTVSIDGGGQAQEFQLVVKACGGSEQPEVDAPATKKGPFQGVGPCACATTQDSIAPLALLGMVALLVARRRR